MEPAALLRLLKKGETGETVWRWGRSGWIQRRSVVFCAYNVNTFFAAAGYLQSFRQPFTFQRYLQGIPRLWQVLESLNGMNEQNVAIALSVKLRLLFSCTFSECHLRSPLCRGVKEQNRKKKCSTDCCQPGIKIEERNPCNNWLFPASLMFWTIFCLLSHFGTCVRSAITAGCRLV